MPVKNSVGGARTLARPKLADYAWLSVHMPKALLALVREVADAEDRAVSSMARRLMEEALIARGHTIPKRGGETIPDGPDGTTPLDRDEAGE
jgi:hypothetical protein